MSRAAPCSHDCNKPFPLSGHGCLQTSLPCKSRGVFGLAADKIERDVPLTRLGLDSLMALELTIRLEREIGTKIPMSNLLGGRTINGLGEPILRLLNQTGSS